MGFLRRLSLGGSVKKIKSRVDLTDDSVSSVQHSTSREKDLTSNEKEIQN
jgi:hypothetical protein